MSDNTDQAVHCALWYWRGGTPDVMICRDEEEAANIALGMSDGDDDREPMGVQWPSGRTLTLREWDAFLAAEAKEREEWQRRMAAAPPPPPTRTVMCPFDRTRTANVDLDTPPWVGVGGWGR